MTIDQISVVGSIASVIALVVGLFVFVPPIRGLMSRLQGPTKGHARAAIAVVYKDGDVLMVLRRGTAEPLTWQFPAGTINGGEEPALRAIEEVREETGVVCRFDRRLGERLHPDTHVYVYYVALSYEGGDARNKDSEENSDVRWVPADQVPSLVTTNLYGPVARFLSKLAR